MRTKAQDAKWSTLLKVQYEAIRIRVERNLCIDCGYFIGRRAGYCDDLRCGHIDTPIKLTIEEMEEARKRYIIRNKLTCP